MTLESFSLSEQLNGLADLDPDNGFFFQTPSEYYNELTFNRVLTEQQILRMKFSLMFVNIRSVVKNLESLLNYLHTLNIEFTVIGLAESWLTPVTEHLCSVPHYTIMVKTVLTGPVEVWDFLCEILLGISLDLILELIMKTSNVALLSCPQVLWSMKRASWV